jgi:DNA-binding GntR family transcriptional regulator
MTSASRASVREALRQLQAEGLVESHNGRGTSVTVISTTTAQHVYQVPPPWKD